MIKRFRSAGVVLAICICVPAAVPCAAAESATEKAQAKTILVHASQSVIVDSADNVKRVSVARPETADVTVVTPRQMVVIGKVPGTTSLVYWNEAEVPTSLQVVVDVDVDHVRSALAAIAPDARFEVVGAGDSLILTGTVPDNVTTARLADAARPYAKNVVNLLKVERLEQVMLQVRVAEVDRTLAKELGFGAQMEQGSIRGLVSPGNAFSPFFGSLRADRASEIGPNATFGDAVNLFVAKPGLFPKFATFIRFLHDKGAIRTLAEPNLVVANGAEGKFLVGGEFPIVYTTAAGGSSSFAVTYKEFGVRLNFRPTIMPNGEIYLNLAQEVSQLDFANGVVLAGFQIPALKSRKAEAGLQLADGQTFVLAGLIDNKVAKQVTKFPILGDIPVLGALFRNTRFSNNETELMVMVTPTLVRPLSKTEIPALPTERMSPGDVGPEIVQPR